MACVSQIIDRRCVPLNIPIAPYWKDHHFEDRGILSAVDSLSILASAVKQAWPGAGLRLMLCARFGKFLYLEPDQERLDAQIDLVTHDTGMIEAALTTKKHFPNAGISRTIDHCRVCFSGDEKMVAPADTDPKIDLRGTRIEIPAGKIYAELVPFGPAYSNIKDVLAVSEFGAVASIAAPDGLVPNRRADDHLKATGSPFPLDAAFHAACVWAQRFEGRIAFPIGFEKRVVHQPTVPAHRYTARIVPMQKTGDTVIFDIVIHDSAGMIYEVAAGVHMRDVSRGRLKPPEWVRADHEGVYGMWY